MALRLRSNQQMVGRLGSSFSTGFTGFRTPQSHRVLHLNGFSVGMHIKAADPLSIGLCCVSMWIWPTTAPLEPLLPNALRAIVRICALPSTTRQPQRTALRCSCHSASGPTMVFRATLGLSR
jgi:hypothetical protein